jgi:hypothetical protein
MTHTPTRTSALVGLDPATFAHPSDRSASQPLRLADVRRLVRMQLLKLADEEDERASDEAAQVPYWAPIPHSVSGHRAAATALRRAADDLVVAG